MFAAVACGTQIHGTDAALEATLAWLQARYAHDVQVLQAALAGDRDGLTGSQLPIIADRSLCGYPVFAAEARVSVPSQVTAWLARMSSLEGWQHPCPCDSVPSNRSELCPTQEALRSDSQALARRVMPSQSPASTMAGGATQEPPTHSTLGSAR